MLDALRARRPRTGAAAVVTVAVGATLVIASSAADATPGKADLPAAAARHARAAGQDASGRLTGRSIRTLFATVRVFTAPSTGAAIKGKIVRQGSPVNVTCWTTGAYYRDMPIWYEVSGPTAGYVSAFNLQAHYSPAVGVPHCVAPVFKEQFGALEPDLRIRTGPTTAATIAGYAVRLGSQVTVECYVTGAAVYQDPIWYRTVSPHPGYVTGRLLNTGGDPAPGVPHC